MQQPPDQPGKPGPGFRAGFVALVGQPNAGKSTLLNTLLEEKVAIVSDKPQTTRGRITGILNVPNAQVIFVDAPGRLKSTSGINKFLQEEVEDVIEKADVVIAVLGADDSEASVEDLMKRLRGSTKSWVAVVTKGDTLLGTSTPKYFRFLIEEKIPFVTISSLKRASEAREEVLNRVVPLLPQTGQPLFDDELYTTQTVRQMSAELVRESCFEHLSQEIPYGLAVKIVEFKEEGALTRISADLVVDRMNHRPIVLGKGGTQIKAIGTTARLEIEKLVGGKVFLQLHVSVRENWTKNPRIMKELGYVVQKN